MSKKTIYRPGKQGLYNPNNEHDACGIGFVANIKGNKNHSIVINGLEMLENLEHRGAVGADKSVGDGAGMLTNIPDKLFREELKDTSIELPKENHYGVGMIFLPHSKKEHNKSVSVIKKYIKENNLELFHIRNVPVKSSVLSAEMKKSEPVIKQFFVKSKGKSNLVVLEKNLFISSKQISNEMTKLSKKNKSFSSFYISSFSNRMITYKGMLLSNLVRQYFLDLSNKSYVSNFSLIHQRFSTNTFPSWDLAQPFRMICHNGEINTVRGNVNWMNARKLILESKILGKDLKKIWPLIIFGQSDSACFDNALELLTAGGYSVEHAMMLLIPEAWQNGKNMNNRKKDFYKYYSQFSEPWDGPAAVAFTDGKKIGATLDRNGLRPARYFITSDDRLVLSSEMGVLRVEENLIIKKDRLRPGKMLLVDLEEGKIIEDKDLKKQMYSKLDYSKLVKENILSLKNIRPSKDLNLEKIENIKVKQNLFGYTEEDLKFLMKPMIANSAEATGSMGTDTPIAVLSRQNKLLFNYFKQNFAQVTNPAIDPIREELVMSLISYLGERANLLNLDLDSKKRIMLDQPILSTLELNKLEQVAKNQRRHFRAKRFDIVFDIKDPFKYVEKKLEKICKKIELEVKDKSCKIVILSDKKTSRKNVAYPSLLALSAVHQYLIKKGLRTKCSIIVETGEAREVHHFCVLAGYGAEAIHPYLALESLRSLTDLKNNLKNIDHLEQKYIKALGKGILKVMSKMGISTYQSYNGAQIFDAVGLNSFFINKYFTGTSSLIEGVGLEEVIDETKRRHIEGIGSIENKLFRLKIGGEYAYRLDGEKHVWNPNTISDLQLSVRSKDKNKYKKYANRINGPENGNINPRSLFEIKYSNKPIDIKDVESASEIVKRFSTGAMSFGSISREAHTTLASAMNTLGGRSNTGEGGEERFRFKKQKDGQNLKSAIKQVASGRFGVTTEYLVNSTDIQIKIAQGQLPGHKVDEVIAEVRFSTPGVGLISPPPHHDIYSIEDLAQLIFDLKNVNPEARISVKLVSEVGVGTVAAGVAKAKADHITISGFEGGTGASPLTSIKHAGSPWELGLAETQQTLVLNNLRSRISLQVDGGLRTGRDVVIGALLGADEFGFSTAPLISIGCIMMRKCHLNTCPVGIASQNPILRKKFAGKPEHVINYFFFVAEEIRKIMSKMGVKKFNDLIGRTDKLFFNKSLASWKSKGLNFKNIFYSPVVQRRARVYNTKTQQHDLNNVLDKKFIKEYKVKFSKRKNLEMNYNIYNTDRSAGAMFSGFLAKIYGHEGLKENTININLKGTAGQSFGAFTTYGVTFNLAGEANDYVGKGLCGGQINIYPPSDSKIIPENSIIIGNTVLYGAIAGQCYFRGIGGERFAVRNSGAWAVVEGVGDHGCEYMTGGVVLCLGKTGKNFGAGMSGGIAYVYDRDKNFENNCNLGLIDISRIKKTKNNIKKYSFNFLKNNMLNYHEERIFFLLKNHLKFTKSSVAKYLLSNWANEKENFTVVFPKDYKIALENINKKNYKIKKLGE
ncbi:glutamate synthase large subunit [Alphaproteobacteria bacterium]|nr:glutamate synthase large subunit [Alphaproteobacteria bacterium]